MNIATHSSILADANQVGGAVFLVILLAIGLAILIGVVMMAGFFRLWVQAMTSGARVGFIDLIGMTMRKINPYQVVEARIQATRAGLHISQAEMESHILARGNLMRVINAMIAANKANIELPWQTATAIDLAGRDIFDAIQTSVNPKVIDVPNRESGRQTIDAVAKNGIQLKVKAKVTVRTNIKRLVGGATEETIVARVGEGIVTAIGSAQQHTDVLENPDHISKAVLHKGLDANTAFEILSIDIADVDVGDNVGARLQTDQAEADKKRAQAEAEKRRAMAIAHEQEMVAKQAENRALVVLAEAEVPKAMAEAFRSGNLGIMDYYKMKNMQADTGMRNSIAGGDGQKSGSGI